MMSSFKKIAIGVLAAASVASVPASASAVEITNPRSNGLRADVMWGSTASYQGLILWPNNSSKSQEFDLLASTNGHFRIRARHSSKCLALDPRVASANGTPIVQLSSCTAGVSSREWRTQVVFGSTDVVLINRASNRCLDVANGSGGVPQQYQSLQQWDCILTAFDWHSGNQLWRIV